MNEEIQPTQKDTSTSQEVLENESLSVEVKLDFTADEAILFIQKETGKLLTEEDKKLIQGWAFPYYGAQRVIKNFKEWKKLYLQKRKENSPMGENQERVKGTLPESEYRCL